MSQKSEEWKKSAPIHHEMAGGDTREQKTELEHTQCLYGRKQGTHTADEDTCEAVTIVTHLTLVSVNLQHLHANNNAQVSRNVPSIHASTWRKVDTFLQAC